MSTQRLRRSEVPAYVLEKHKIKIAASTLAKLFTLGGGPPVIHFGRTPLYETDALDSWVSARLSAPRKSSSEERRASAEAA